MVDEVHPNFYPERTLSDIRPPVVGIGEGHFSLVQQGYEELRAMVDRLWPERFAGPAPVASSRRR